jgi:hypothetical protein
MIGDVGGKGRFSMSPEERRKGGRGGRGGRGGKKEREDKP